MSFTPTQGASLDSTEGPEKFGPNSSEMEDNTTTPSLYSSLTVLNSTRNYQPVGVNKERKPVTERTVSDGSDIPRDSPTALVIASSIAAVSILVFFVLAYLWHTHQLDSRARKLAIRLAADSERAIDCRSCELQVSRTFPKTQMRPVPRGISETSQEQNQYIALTPDEEKSPGNDCILSSVALENEAVDNDDVFEPMQMTPVSERGRVGVRGGRGSHRKWSRSRKCPRGASFDKRDSAVTDKEILTHFASRRHSTFFI